MAETKKKETVTYRFYNARKSTVRKLMSEKHYEPIDYDKAISLGWVGDEDPELTLMVQKTVKKED
jgi:hypothetical protein